MCGSKFGVLPPFLCRGVVADFFFQHLCSGSATFSRKRAALQAQPPFWRLQNLGCGCSAVPSGLKLVLWLQSGALFLGPQLGPPPLGDFLGPTWVPQGGLLELDPKIPWVRLKVWCLTPISLQRCRRRHFFFNTSAVGMPLFHENEPHCRHSPRFRGFKT